RVPGRRTQRRRHSRRSRCARARADGARRAGLDAGDRRSRAFGAHGRLTIFVRQAAPAGVVSAGPWASNKERTTMKRIMLLGWGRLGACAPAGGGGGAAAPSSSSAQAAHHEKGGGHKGAEAKGQHEGARAKAAMSNAQEAGEELDGIVCNGETEGVA